MFGEALTFCAPARGLADAAGAPGAARRGHRRLDRDRLPPGRDEPLRGRRAHRAPRGRASSRSSASTSCGRRRRRDLLGDAVELTDGYRILVVLHPPLHRHARLRLRVRLRRAARAVGVTSATSRRARASRSATSSCWRSGGSRSPQELGEIVGIDLRDPAFWDRGLDLVERRLERGRSGAPAEPPRTGGSAAAGGYHRAMASGTQRRSCWPRSPRSRSFRRRRVATTVLHASQRPALGDVHAAADAHPEDQHERADRRSRDAVGQARARRDREVPVPVRRHRRQHPVPALQQALHASTGPSRTTSCSRRARSASR